MGMYTDFRLNCELEGSSMDDYFSILESAMKKEAIEDFPDHEFFHDGGYRMLTHSWCGLHFDRPICLVDDDGGVINLELQLTTKNGHLVNSFLDWVSPYIISLEDEFLGISHYEGFDAPDLIFGSEDRGYKVVRVEQGDVIIRGSLNPSTT